jgi:hypothetical protein
MFQTQRTRLPTARQSMLKQFAHSPHRPSRVCIRRQTSLYLGNRLKLEQLEHW